MGNLKSYLFFLNKDKGSLSNFLDYASGTSAFDAALSYYKGADHTRGSFEGGFFAIEGREDMLDEHNEFELPEGGTAEFVDEDELFERVDSLAAEEEDANDDSAPVALNVGIHTYDDGLRLICEGTYTFGAFRVPSASVGVYRELEDGHSYGRETTVRIPTLGRDVMKANTLRSYVEARLSDIEAEEIEAQASAY